MIREVLTLSRLRAMAPDEAAATLIVRQAEGEFPHDRMIFEQWLELGEENRAAWERAKLGWRAFDDAGPDELLDAMREHARSARPAPSERWSHYATAAALCLAILTGSMVAERAGMFGDGGEGIERPDSPSSSAPVYYATGRELPRTVTLPDGSRMVLDADTRVAAIFGKDRRRLEILKGRAYFSVLHDSARPFAVLARDLEITAIGTRFDVAIAGPQIKVLLAEGRLSVATPSHRAAKPIIMSAGERLTSVGGAAPTLSGADTAEAASWQDGFATFDDDTLADAAAELNRYPGDRLIVRDRKVAGLRISGRFKAGDAERFARTLEQVHPVRVVRRSGQEIEIVPAG